MLHRRPAGLLALTATVLLLPAAPALAKDRDRDGLPDRWEKCHKVARPGGDADRDGLRNAFEQRAKLHPRRKDTDRDGVADGLEDGDRDGLVNAGEAFLRWDPRDRDTDGDDLLDGEEGAGVVRSVAGPVVTVDLLTGGTVTALVTEDTDLFCDASADEDEDAGLADDDGWDDEDLGADEDEGEDPEEDLAGDDSADEDVAEDEEDLDAEDAPAECGDALLPGAVVFESSAGDDGLGLGLVLDVLDLVG